MVNKPNTSKKDKISNNKVLCDFCGKPKGYLFKLSDL